MNFPYWDLATLLDLMHNIPKLGKEAMRLLGRDKLQDLLRADETVRTWVCAWVTELTTANWKQAADVSHQFPSVRRSDQGHFIFPISNCTKEVFLQIAFQQGIAVITDLQ